MFIEAGQDILTVERGVQDLNVRSYPFVEDVPQIWRITDAEVALGPATTGASFLVRWRRAMDSVAFFIMAKSATVSNEEALGALTLQWEDDKDRQFGTDGKQPQVLPTLAMFSDKEWHPLMFVSVKHNDVFRFQFANTHAAATITPVMLYRFVDRVGP